MATIAQFMNYGAPYQGNFLRSMLLLEKELENSGDKMIYIFAFYDERMVWAEDLVEAGKDVYFMTGNKVKDVFLLKKILTKHKVDIIHTHFSTKSLFLINFALKLMKRKVLVVRHLHNPYSNQSNLVEFVRKTVAPCQLVIGCGKYLTEDYNKIKKDKREKVLYLANGIDFNRFSKTDIIPKSEDNPKSFLLFGFDFYRKGVDLALNAFNNLASKGEVFALYLSVAVDRVQAEQLIIKEMGEIPKWLNVVDGIDDVESYYRKVDFFVSASRSEGLCYSLVEAVYCGVQLIISDIEGHTEWKIPHAIEFKSEDVGDFSMKLEKALKMSRQEIMNENEVQRDFVVKNCGAQQWAQKMAQIYKDY